MVVFVLFFVIPDSKPHMMSVSVQVDKCPLCEPQLLVLLLLRICNLFLLLLFKALPKNHGPLFANNVLSFL
jgi:hypothetical protein